MVLEMAVTALRIHEPLRNRSTVPVWTLEDSVFGPRHKEADTKGFVESPEMLLMMMDADMRRCLNRNRFTKLVVQGMNEIEGFQELERLQNILKKHYYTIVNMFYYYSAISVSASITMMGLNEWACFLDSTSVIDPQSKHCKRADMDRLFIEANHTGETKTKDKLEYDSNSIKTLMRFEFIEALCRLALVKIAVPKSSAKDAKPLLLSQALEALLTVYILPNAQLEATESPDKFRKERMYLQEVDLLLWRYVSSLQHIYDYYRKFSSVRRVKVDSLGMTSEDWTALLRDGQITTQSAVMDNFSKREQQLVFAKSKMCVIDEIPSIKRMQCLTFVEFLEALCRSADFLSLPNSAQLKHWGETVITTSTVEWKTRGEAPTLTEYFDKVSRGAPAIPQRESAGFCTEKFRPLVEKLFPFIELLLTGLCKTHKVDKHEALARLLHGRLKSNIVQKAY
ncbi:hypothetical protein CYMTET_41101 [Cymbomonas tetramitiformis]|uniref:Uncharacterized protein n=1 Tax=Cymbomonas tetramitiformis TaxID=36881 RepID=A0AAE0C8J2_9CHLO|nr:hypothetical protein CYMTET_41101 [Cymbomonas tetramitiformis]